jgi:cytochrome c oxidase cbb3-type subunit 3
MHCPRRFGLFFLAALLASALMMSLGCKKPAGEGAGEAAPPTAAAGKMRFVAITPQNVAKGKALFGACIGCHGDGASGRVGIGPRLHSKSFLAAASDEYLVNTIKNGRAGTTMVAWGASYKDDQIHALVAYLRSLNAVEPATLNQAPLAGNVDEGARVWRNICASCHGRSGAGYQETANGTGIGRRGFLDKASNGFIRHIVSHGKSLTGMKGFGQDKPAAVANLSPQEIDSTIAYLRKNAW